MLQIRRFISSNSSIRRKVNTISVNVFSTHSHFLCFQLNRSHCPIVYVFLAHKYRIVKWDQFWCCVRVEMRFCDAMQICALVWDYVGKSLAHAEDLFRFELSDGGMKTMTVSYASRISTPNQLANWCYIVVLTPFANCARNIYPCDGNGDGGECWN